MATSAQFTAQPLLEMTNYSTADTSLTAPTNFVTIASAPTAAAANGVGKRILRVSACTAATNAAATLRFWLTKDNGTTKWLICEKVLAANTITAGSSSALRIEIPELNGLILPGGTLYAIYASQSIATQVNYFVESGAL